MKTEYKIIQNIMVILQCGFYGFWILAVIINPETWFFGVKFGGIAALVIHFTIGISGIILGWFVYQSNKIAYFGALALFLIAISSILVNTLSCSPFDLYC